MSTAPGPRGRPAAPPEARPRWALLATIAGSVLLLDQLTKWWAVDTLGDGRVIDVVWTLRFKLAYNTGSAFSLAEGRGAIISLLALVVVALLLRTGRQATQPLAALALGLVVGGAIGNLVDRAVRDGPHGAEADGFLGGAVVDFLDLQWWPVFNVADAAIVCGAALLIISSWRDAADDSSEGPADGEPAQVDGASRTDAL